MGRLNNIAECKSYMTENGNRAVHRSTTLRPDCTSRSPAQKMYGAALYQGRSCRR